MFAVGGGERSATTSERLVVLACLPTTLQVLFGLILDDASAVSKANGMTVSVSWTQEFAFDTAVRRKPLAGAADAGCYGNSIDFCLKRLARRGL